ncbi:MAG TPA: Uma2 family endonuclease [Anaerolineae bacterium]|nr:Uma2 family endonuclease [Anaerolineae bacterium]
MSTHVSPSPQPTRQWPPEQGQWTYEDWLRLPDDGFRYEVLNGVLHMTPPPTILHQNTVTYLSARMRSYADSHDLGLVLASPVGVRLPGQPVPVQPDILFIRKERRDLIGEDTIEGAPDLVVEVLSPSNWPYDRGETFEAYRKGGVPEYWIVDYRARTIEVLVLEGTTYVLIGKFGPGQAARSTVLAGFEVAVDDVFAE